MQVNELFRQSNTILLDGGMGTMLQAAGLKLGARPEELNITDPALIEGIHGQYAAAGSRIVNANTFGASAHKLLARLRALRCADRTGRRPAGRVAGTQRNAGL